MGLPHDLKDYISDRTSQSHRINSVESQQHDHIYLTMQAGKDWRYVSYDTVPLINKEMMVKNK